jgi:hypothetical protein
MPLLLLRFLLRNLLLSWWVCLYMLFVFSFLQSSIFFPCSLHYLFFNENVPWRGSFLVKTVWCPGDFVYPNGQLFLKIWEFFSIILLTVLHNPLACTSSPSLMLMLHRFGFWWRVTEFFQIQFSALESFSLRVLLFFFFNMFLFLALRFCLPLVIGCWSGFLLYFYLI